MVLFYYLLLRNIRKSHLLPAPAFVLLAAQKKNALPTQQHLRTSHML
jgi:hypothetical protein